MYWLSQSETIGVVPRAESGRYLERVLFNLPWMVPLIPAPLYCGDIDSVIKEVNAARDRPVNEAFCRTSWR